MNGSLLVIKLTAQLPEASRPSGISDGPGQ